MIVRRGGAEAQPTSKIATPMSRSEAFTPGLYAYWQAGARRISLFVLTPEEPIIAPHEILEPQP